MPRFDAVLFDYGHTVVDLQRPRSHLLKAYHQINQRLERELQRSIPQAADLLVAVSEKVDDDIGDSYRTGSEQEVDIADLYRTALRTIGISCPEETLQWVIDQEQVAWFNGILPSPHARPVLLHLRQEGVKTAIVSNAAFPPRSMRDQLRHLELFDLFDATVYSSEVGIRKPNPAIYEAALGLVGVAPQRALFIGDRMREDVRGPRGVGMEAVLTHEFRQETPAAGVEVEVLEDLRPLLALVGVLRPEA
jgi:putative hydrolase of the HAD superfamily